MRNACAKATFLVLMFFPYSANADRMDLWHGWMNITPCSKLITDNGFPYTKWGEQELHGYIYITYPADAAQWMRVIEDRLKDCAVQGVVSAGGTVALIGPSGAWPAFSATFKSCVSQTDYRHAFEFGLERKSVCNY